MRTCMLPLLSVILLIAGGFSTPPKSAALENSTWKISFTVPGEKKYSYLITFKPGGKLVNRHPNDQTPDNDKWEQKGNEVRLFINDKYVEYRGTIKGKKMSGMAKNINNETWRWSAVRTKMQ